MDVDNLVHMANRIGEFFEAMPDREEASAELLQHLRKFWAPPMRRTLLAHIDAGDTTALRPIVLEAIRAHREALA